MALGCTDGGSGGLGFWCFGKGREGWGENVEARGRGERGKTEKTKNLKIKIKKCYFAHGKPAAGSHDRLKPAKKWVCIEVKYIKTETSAYLVCSSTLKQIVELTMSVINSSFLNL